MSRICVVLQIVFSISKSQGLACQFRNNWAIRMHHGQTWRRLESYYLENIVIVCLRRNLFWLQAKLSGSVHPYSLTQKPEMMSKMKTLIINVIVFMPKPFMQKQTQAYLKKKTRTP